jgi:hypothetical protein
MSRFIELEPDMDESFALERGRDQYGYRPCARQRFGAWPEKKRRPIRVAAALTGCTPALGAGSRTQNLMRAST